MSNSNALSKTKRHLQSLHLRLQLRNLKVVKEERLKGAESRVLGDPDRRNRSAQFFGGQKKKYCPAPTFQKTPKLMNPVQYSN
jgi:hypothetical protein